MMAAVTALSQWKRATGTWARLYAAFPRMYDFDLLDRSPRLAAGVEGACFADLACGTGRIGGWLTDAGARTIRGIDRCPEMLEEAARRGCYEMLRLADMTDTGLESGVHDGVITSMALCHAADLGAFYREARRLLKETANADPRPSSKGKGPANADPRRPANGRVLLAIVDYHPFFLLRGIPTHFEHPDSGERIAIVNHIHALSEHFGAGQRNGFTLREFEERFVDEAWADASPNFAKHLGLPITFLMVFESA